jgi:hypothetical protein
MTAVGTMSGICKQGFTTIGKTSIGKTVDLWKIRSKNAVSFCHRFPDRGGANLNKESHNIWTEFLKT